MSGKEAWGPPLWRLLHSLAERLGAQVVPVLMADEKRAWVNLLRAVGAAMPCLACKAHFKEWATRNPIERFTGSYALREDARRWLWALHKEVRGAAGSPEVEELPALYGSSRLAQDLNEDYKAVCASFQLAVQQRSLAPEAFMTFKTRVVALRAITG